jgi:hypothetical protein
MGQDSNMIDAMIRKVDGTKSGAHGQVRLDIFSMSSMVSLE